jgi:PAS domain S-box-containing protein
MTIRVAVLLCLLLSGLCSLTHAQEKKTVKRILALYWYGKDFPANITFDEHLKSVFNKQSDVEYYAEYLESNRFPGESQSVLLRDYIRQKYSDRKIDVVIASSSMSLNFLLKHRAELFSDTPVVFHAYDPPQLDEQRADLPITGVVSDHIFGKTLDVALKLHPAVTQAIVIVRTSEGDPTLETDVRRKLSEFESRVKLSYLTDLPLDTLLSEVRKASDQSIIFFVRYSEDEPGKSIDPYEALSLITQSAKVPVYSLTSLAMLGRGSVGGYAVDIDACAEKVAQMSLSIANGRSVREVPVVMMPSVLRFDSRQLKRWEIREDQLPLGSVVLFAQPTVWQQYKWRILGIGVVFLIQTSLIAGLLVERSRRSRATRRLSESEERYRNVVQTQTELICRYLPDTTLTFVNDAYCRYFGKSRAELIGTKFIELIPEHARKQTLSHVNMLLEDVRIKVNEHEAILPDGTIAWQQWINRAIVNNDGQIKELQGIGRDVTERKLAEQALQISEQRFAKAFKANPQPMSLTTFAEGRYIDVNESFLQMSGYERREVIGSTSFELRIFEKPEDREELVGPLRENGSVRNLELKFRTKGGEFRILLSSAELIDLGRQQCILVASSDITDRKHLEEERLQAENELSELTARLFTLQDEERRRIARELHDGTAQNLFAVSIDIDLMRKQAENGNAELKSLLDESAELCEQSLEEIRTLSYVLHPPLLDQAGLVSALKWYVEGFTKRTGIEVNLVAMESVGRMRSEIETALFRIVQESLTNIRRHSQSETASIRLRRDAREIRLEIQDRGHGMNVNTQGGPIDEMHELGVGIPGMRQRLRQLGGRLDIMTGAAGTVITAIIPLTDRPARSG